MRVVVTGAGGFVGRAVVGALAARGDSVVALVRDPSTSPLAGRRLAGSPIELVRSDLGDVPALTETMRGADAVIHAAGSYRVGIPASERPAMHEANVGTTERVLEAAMEGSVPSVVYVSTVGIFGNTRGRVVDETFRRDPRDGFVSTYDETKHLGHLVAERRISEGAPIVIVQPGQVYGPHDHSAIGGQLSAAYHGTLPFVGLGGVGLGFVHVEDLAGGIVAALDRGQVARSYVLSGDNVRLRDALAVAARAGGQALPRLSVPDLPLRIGATLLPAGGRLFGLAPNLREIIRASVGVTYWASSSRAAAELGFRPRPIAEGFADAYGGGPGSAGGRKSE